MRGKRIDMIEKLLKNKNSKERANIKGKEIAKVNFRGKHTDTKTKIKIEITDIKEIEGGVEVFARAWKGKKQLGFGKDHILAGGHLDIFFS